MTPAQQAKSVGLKSLTQVSNHFGIKPNGQPVVSLNTLDNWHKHKPKLFQAVLIGVREIEGLR